MVIKTPKIKTFFTLFTKKKRKQDDKDENTFEFLWFFMPNGGQECRRKMVTREDARMEGAFGLSVKG